MALPPVSRRAMALPSRIANAFCNPSISCLRRAWRSSKEGAFVSQLPLRLSKYSMTAESSSPASLESNFVSDTKLSRRPFSATLQSAKPRATQQLVDVQQEKPGRDLYGFDK